MRPGTSRAGRCALHGSRITTPARSHVLHANRHRQPLVSCHDTGFTVRESRALLRPPIGPPQGPAGPARQADRRTRPLGGPVSTDLERFVATDVRDEAVARVRSEIDARGITYIYYQFASVTGRIMGKGVPADHWEQIAGKGFQLVYGSTANLFTDR